MNTRDVESILTDLGFSLYEARAYASQVHETPSTGYELAKRSGIPRSKIYECIERLARKRILMPVGDNPVKYIAVPPEELVRRMSSDFETSIGNLERLLAGNGGEEAYDFIFNINGYDDIIGRAEEMIGKAAMTLDLSLWREEIERLAPSIRDAVERGIRVRLISFDGGEVAGAECHHHRPLVPEEFTGRWITLIRDGAEVLTGQCSDGNAAVAAWTRNKCLVFVSMKYIEHEIIKLMDSGNKPPPLRTDEKRP